MVTECGNNQNSTKLNKSSTAVRVSCDK